MTLWLGVENFGRIKDAKICINKYTVLVGPNNSGKSFLMQLADGINDYIVKMKDVIDLSSFMVKKEKGYKEYLLNSKNCNKVTEYINDKLAIEKKEVVKSILGKDIEVERLYIDWEIDPSIEYRFVAFDLAKIPYESIKNVIPIIDSIINVMIEPSDSEGSMVLLVSHNLKTNTEAIRYASRTLGELKDDMVQRVMLRSLFANQSLYMPASRNGLLLMYRDFFANKADNALEFNMHYGEGIENEGVTTETGLTKPVYKFLRFLQTYTQDDNYRFKDEMAFFNEHIIEGNIIVNEQGIFSYQSKVDDLTVPMYLASSMINELVPLYPAITTNQRYRRLVIDEVESSLHPQKQMELVRMLNRLNNKGYQFIISTHSDTIVSKINNLYRMSKKGVAKEELEQIGLEQIDFINPDNLYVYEFDITEGGKSSVREVK